jgi:ABC-type nitrate/sulfonate/bicarbonate transport system substrate-binding protein
MKKNIGLSAILLTALLALSGCGAGGRTQAPAPAPSADGGKAPFTLRVVQQTIFNDINIADELGFFADENIKIEYVGTLGQGVSEFQAVEQGDADVFAQGHPPQVAQARLAGSKVKVVAPGIIDTENYPHIRYLVKEDSPLTDFSQVAGKKVAIGSYSACTNGFIDYYLLGLGYAPGSVEYTNIATAGGAAELAALNGQIDVTTSHAPFGTIALAAGGLRQLATSWTLFENPASAYSVRGFAEDFIAKRPDVVQGFVNAMYRARLWTNARVEDDARAVIAESLGLELGDVQGFLYSEEKNINDGYIQHWVEISEKIGTWEAGAVKSTDIYTNEFVPKDAPESDKTLRWKG